MVIGQTPVQEQTQASLLTLVQEQTQVILLAPTTELHQAKLWQQALVPWPVLVLEMPSAIQLALAALARHLPLEKVEASWLALALPRLEASQ